MVRLRTLVCAIALLASACGKLIGIEDYQLRDAPGAVDVTPIDAALIDAPFGSALAYIKASNAEANDQFGGISSQSAEVTNTIGLSEDGTTLVVGASFEDSAATGVDGDQLSNAAVDSGAAYVFVRNGTTWTQQAYLKASNTQGNDRFGTAVAISGDGNTIAIGAVSEDSSSSGINGNQADNNAGAAGAVYVFTRSGTAWTQQAYIKASNADGGDQFGTSVALSTDGSTLAVGSPFEDSSATIVNGGQTDENPQIGANYGAAYVFVRASGTWLQQAYVKASNANSGDLFGQAVALSGDGDTLAVGAYGEDSSATGVNGNQADNNAGDAGAGYIYKRNGGIWAQQAYLKAGNPNGNDYFGYVIALSRDGNTFAAGAYGEDGSSTGINGAFNNNAGASGAVYVFAQIAQTWTAQAYVKPSNTGAQDVFGLAVALSGDGNQLLVGAPLEDGASKGLGGTDTDNTAADAGAAYVFARTGTTWAQSMYLKATNTEAGDRYGAGCALNDGLYVVGASVEDGGSKGIGGNQDDNTALSSGAVYVVQ